VSVDGAVVTSGVTAAIPANSTVLVATTPITAGAPRQYQVTVTLDPSNNTGLVSSGGGTQTILITIQAIIGNISALMGCQLNDGPSSPGETAPTLMMHPCWSSTQCVSPFTTRVGAR
jgi:hypothetical protein